MNDVIAAILARHSVRRFTPDPVPAESIDLILTAARRAPSAGNRQPWLFLVVGEVGADNRPIQASGGWNSGRALL
ncbi:MAG TPA: nitroreductase family protein [Spirochaetia bacterium]|nr:nitroreductase family protein [Spirochaetia bacterium]